MLNNRLVRHLVMVTSNMVCQVLMTILLVLGLTIMSSGGVTNSTNVKKKKKEKEARLHKKPLNKDRKAATIEKTFQQNTLTIKFKIHDIQQKAGKDPDFALFIKDDIHDPNSKALPVYQTASKYITYTKGSIAKKFFSKAGISYHRCPQDFFLCSNEIGFTEIKIEVVRKFLLRTKLFRK